MYYLQYGVLQSDGEVDLNMVDHYIRKHLNQTAKRWVGVVIVCRTYVFPVRCFTFECYKSAH